MQGGAGTEPAVVTPPRHAAVLDALRRLPGRQREALILRYYADLSEAEIAETMRVNRTAVIGHLSGGMAALTQALAQLLEPTS
jgi:RNA polymerase sigma factor (sigma-70 family)